MDQSSSNNDEMILEMARAAGLPTERFPQTNQEADMIENLLAKAMEKLSMDEQEKIVFDVHGFVDCEDEDPVTVDLRLKELDEELTKIQEKEAYMLALKMNETYVTSRKFRLMFLRREKFHVKAAAVLVVKHFEVKRKLFGNGQVLGRNVRQSDLTPESQSFLEAGYYQVLPSRDAAGRTLFILTSANAKIKMEKWTVDVDTCAVWYLIMTVLQDEETQKKGIVWIAMHFQNFQISPDEYRTIQDIDKAIPYRTVSGHFCYSDPAIRILAAGFRLHVGTDERNRMRIHYGTQEEINFKLQTFGIPTEDIVFQEDGALDATTHNEFLTMLKAQEDAETETKAIVGESEADQEKRIIVPGRFDVLFGRSRMAREHTGTKRALHIVEMEFDTYERLGKYQKAEVSDRIISIIHQSGGNFLRQNDKGAWVLAEDRDVRNKIGHWFRHTRSKRTSSRGEAVESISFENSNGSADEKADSCVAKRVASYSSDESGNRCPPCMATKVANNDPES